MNEDEAFIRAIVDSPGDDTPRLVYADWLDDRNDPRGPYLRAEQVWGNAWREGNPPGDSSELRQLAAALDPVWVARVSRAPMGVCFETKLFIHDYAPPANAEAIDAAANEFGIIFPPEYRAFLLNYNCGWLSTPGEAYFPEADDFFGDVAGVSETNRDVFAECEENRRCGLFLVAGTAGASGTSILLGVGLANEPFGKRYRRLYCVDGYGVPWIENGELIEPGHWSGNLVDSLPELFAMWEQTAIERLDWEREKQRK